MHLGLLELALHEPRTTNDVGQRRVAQYSKNRPGLAVYSPSGGSYWVSLVETFQKYTPVGPGTRTHSCPR